MRSLAGNNSRSWVCNAIAEIDYRHSRTLCHSSTDRYSEAAIATLVEHLPDYVKVALAAIAEELECPMTYARLETIAILVEHLPDYVEAALAEKAEELECSLEAAITSFLDEEAFSFEDCLLVKR